VSGEFFDMTSLAASGVTEAEPAGVAALHRAKVMEMTQAAEDAVLAPATPGAWPADLRAALAARIARLNGDEALAARFASRMTGPGFAPLAELYRKALGQFGREELPVAVHSPGHIADTDEQARDELWPHYADIMGRIGRERGWGPITRAHFEQEAGPHGALYAGSPETVAQKIAAAVRAIGVSRFDLKVSNGTLPHELMMGSIERYGTVVVPRVRELLSEPA